MLQQTQVSTVIPYFEAFLGRFPTVSALAEAPLEAILTAWSGLGYYSRARNLHRGARYLIEKHSGHFPRSREEILKVPGIGPYTAGAVLSIAFNQAEPLVDGNVQRVFARYYCVSDEVSSRAAQRQFWERATEWVSAAKAPRALNQGLMELGATICIKGSPRCDRCPLRITCAAFAKGCQRELPVKHKRRNFVDLWWISLVYIHRDRYFLRKNPSGEWWSDLWDFPRRNAGSESAWRKFRHKRGWRELDLQTHTVTHHHIHVAPYLIDTARAPHERGGKWFSSEELRELPLSSLAKKVLRATI